MISSIFLILFTLLKKQESYKLPVELENRITPESLVKVSYRKPLFFIYPFLTFNRYILGWLGGKYFSSQLKSAEINLSPEEYLGINEIFILILLGGAIVLIGRIEPLWIGILVLLGFFGPDLYLKTRIQKRKRLIIKALPEAIDLLTLCVEGGLDIMLGLEWVLRRSPKTPLMNEFSLVLQEVKVGKPRQEALKDMAKRVSVPEVFSFVNTLVHTERMGTPVAEILNILSEEARRQRFQKGERLALQAPIKMLFPLIFFIFPVVGIIVAGPVLLQFIQGGLPKF